ncbi:MAG TPA: FAD-dependent monooxygenase [Pseudonocardia sp.]|nr:FAD-dependent monooxygenase [Pseudonocardia sp.]
MIIVLGGGPVGLGAALELARFGVRTTLIEKHPATSWHPKTRNLNSRTMEIARGWGNVTYQRLRGIDTPPGWKSPIRFTRSATGEQFGMIESKGFEGPGEGVSPALPVMSSQDLIEEILFDAAQASEFIDVRFGTEAVELVTGADPDDTEVVLKVRSRATGEQETIHAAALVAADGAESSTRERLGIRLEGKRDLNNVINCYFRADIEPHVSDRTGVLYFVYTPEIDGVLQPLDARGRWLCQIFVPEQDWSLDVYTPDRVTDWVRTASGIDDLAVDVLSVGLWKLNATVAERLVQGRVVLCGDAAHQVPPTGGLGVNTGLQGAHNVMWKLAMHVTGRADWSLVQTYDAERRSVAQDINEQSLRNAVNIRRINSAASGGGESGLTAEQIVTASRRYGNHFGVEFGASYNSSAVIPDGTQPPRVDDSFSDYEPSATPGCRAPHVWLGTGDGRVSTIDLVGTGFTLFAGPDAGGWCESARAARDGGADVAVYRVGAAGLDDDGSFTRAYGIDDGGAVLVRPDGHVAWRSTGPPSSGTEVGEALARLLS